MKALVEKLCLDVVMTACLSVVLGVVFFVYPVETVDTASRIVALIIFVFGVAQIAMGMVRKSGFSIITTIGILITAVGIWMIVYPQVLVGVIPFFIGLLIVSHGILGIKSAVDAGRCKFEKWGVLFALSAISLIVGILTVLNAFDIVELTAKIIGIFLVYDGIAGLIVVIRARLVTRKYERDLQEREAIEVHSAVVDEEITDQ